MISAFLVSDLHGSHVKYNKLIKEIEEYKPEIVFIAGDILPSGLFHLTSSVGNNEDFLDDFLIPAFENLKVKMKESYPDIYIIMGNDDARIDEKTLQDAEANCIWHYLNNTYVTYEKYTIFGYCYVPPTPFQLKDWEKYDVSRYVDPGCVSPEEGMRTVPVRKLKSRNSTIQKDLKILTEDKDLTNSIFLFHSPPYQTNLDRAALDDKIIDHVSMDVNVGSIAIKRFIENLKPFITIHGHVHESSRLTGNWYDKIEETHCYGAAYDGPELAIIKLDLENPESANRILI